MKSPPRSVQFILILASYLLIYFWARGRWYSRPVQPQQLDFLYLILLSSPTIVPTYLLIRLLSTYEWIFGQLCLALMVFSNTGLVFFVARYYRFFVFQNSAVAYRNRIIASIIVVPLILISLVFVKTYRDKILLWTALAIEILSSILMYKGF